MDNSLVKLLLDCVWEYFMFFVFMWKMEQGLFIVVIRLLRFLQNKKMDLKNENR